MEHCRNERVGETRDPRENPQTSGNRPARFPLAKIGVNRPGIELGSPWWKTSSPSAQLPWPLAHTGHAATTMMHLSLCFGVRRYWNSLSFCKSVPTQQEQCKAGKMWFPWGKKKHAIVWYELTALRRSPVGGAVIAHERTWTTPCIMYGQVACLIYQQVSSTYHCRFTVPDDAGSTCVLPNGVSHNQPPSPSQQSSGMPAIAAPYWSRGLARPPPPPPRVLVARPTHLWRRKPFFCLLLKAVHTVTNNKDTSVAKKRVTFSTCREIEERTSRQHSFTWYISIAGTSSITCTYKWLLQANWVSKESDRIQAPDPTLLLCGRAGHALAQKPMDRRNMLLDYSRNCRVKPTLDISVCCNNQVLYAVDISVCCNNQVLYAVDISVCCNDQVLYAVDISVCCNDQVLYAVDISVCCNDQVLYAVDISVYCNDQVLYAVDISVCCNNQVLYAVDISVCCNNQVLYAVDISEPWRELTIPRQVSHPTPELWGARLHLSYEVNRLQQRPANALEQSGAILRLLESVYNPTPQFFRCDNVCCIAN
ncbi:hypothetical protein PR048_028492 [Dryococelus australis]|uniref:Galaxin-like repeats domain-containing protein n=1 Tax=Dryococelus australis TaxID=614101 RepID=A0ABQ9GDA4_9NEOP|nr:hypothetical protein PR048_028492 [Dryococelus australis]